MRKILILAILFMPFLGCNSPNENKIKNVDSLKTTTKIIGKKFFVYDEIDYYTNEIKKLNTKELFNNQSSSELDSIKSGIIIGNIPQSITDTTFINKLTKVGYKKTQIHKSKFDSIDSIFIEKTTTENLTAACVYVYRDILIFKKDNKVIGIAKICFDCMGHQISGTNANTENFGQDGDYKRLKKILQP